MSAATVAKIDAEIAKLQAEAQAIEAAPPMISERLAVIEGELAEAETIFRTHGLNPSFGHPAQTDHMRRLALVGMTMVANGPKVLQAERERIERQGEGLSNADKRRRLDQLAAAVLRLAAQREVALRPLEGDEFFARPIHAELAIFKAAAVEAIAR